MTTRLPTSSGNGTDIGNDRGSEPVATFGSPEKDEPEELPGWTPDRTGGDFGYSAGAREINAHFKNCLKHARRTTAPAELPLAVRALRERRTAAIMALREHCARKRRDWHLAGREAMARLRSPMPRGGLSQSERRFSAKASQNQRFQ